MSSAFVLPVPVSGCLLPWLTVTAQIPGVVWRHGGERGGDCQGVLQQGPCGALAAVTLADACVWTKAV